MCTKFILKPIVVDGTSMFPTLHDKDFGFSFVLGSLFKSYQRFDVVVVYYEEEDKYLVKRIVGLPKEKIEYRDDVLYVNDNPIKESFFDKEWVSKNTFGGHTSFTDNMKPVFLDDDEYFVVGDNRPNSIDSRKLGPVKSSQIISKHALILWPFDSFGLVRRGS